MVVKMLTIIAAIAMTIPLNLAKAEPNFRIEDAVGIINANLATMDGKLTEKAEQDAKIWRIVARFLAQNPSARSQLSQAAQQALESTSPNQKQAFLEAIIQIVCQSANDNCALKQELAKLKIRFDLLEQQLRPHGGYYRGPFPSPSPDTIPNETFALWEWVGPAPDFISDRRSSFCRNANLQGENCLYYLANGEVRYGDFYEDCQGRIVLLLRPMPDDVWNYRYAQ